MFSIFVFIFSAVVALWASAYFLHAFQKNPDSNYRDFSVFFFTLAVGYAVFVVASLSRNIISFSLGTEILTFSILFSFAFVLRAFMRFQQIRVISVNFISAVIGIIAAARFITVWFYFPSAPVIKDNLIYWNYPAVSSISFWAFLFLYCIAMTTTFLSNLKNIQTHKYAIIFLSFAFLFGGLAGVFITNSHTYIPLLSGYIFLLITWMLAILFLITPF